MVRPGSRGASCLDADPGLAQGLKVLTRNTSSKFSVPVYRAHIAAHAAAGWRQRRTISFVKELKSRARETLQLQRGLVQLLYPATEP